LLLINGLVFFQRMDLGDCPKIHDLALRADYEQASKKRDYYYDIDVSSRFVVGSLERLQKALTGFVC